jgi:hypothetical protein
MGGTEGRRSGDPAGATIDQRRDQPPGMRFDMSRPGKRFGAWTSMNHDDEQPRDTPTSPTTRSGDLGRESGLAIDSGKRGLRVRHHGLDLGHQNDPSRLMERKDIYRTSFSADRKRHLDVSHPTDQVQTPHEAIDQSCVGLVEETIQTLAVPPEPHVQVGVERLRDTPQLADRNGVDPPALDPGDDRGRDLRLRAKIHLAPAFPEAERAERVTETDGIHLQEHGGARLSRTYSPHVRPCDERCNRVRRCRPLEGPTPIRARHAS